MPTDYGAQRKTSGTIVLDGPCYTLSIDIVGPLPADWRMEHIITFADCFSEYLILIQSKDHMGLTVSNALLDQVIPYFGVPRRLLSDRGQEFMGQVWEEVLKALGIQQVLTSPYHPEGNTINEWSHRTMNNMALQHLIGRTKFMLICSPLTLCLTKPHKYSPSPRFDYWSTAFRMARKPFGLCSGILE